MRNVKLTAGRWAIAGGMASAAVVASLVLACAGVPSGGSAPARPGPAKGDYPAPRTAYRGVAAPEWHQQALDADDGLFYAAIEALGRLGAEATPYVIDLCDRNRTNSRLGVCLTFLRAKSVATVDLPFFEQFLGDRYADSDPAPFNNVRMVALSVFAEAGPPAAPFLPAVERLTAVEHLAPKARHVVRVIKGMSADESTAIWMREAKEIQANPKKK